MRTPTIRDVAKHAGVGVGTVSRVLNGSDQVREDTRKRVLEAINALGFSPNSAARQLSGGKTFTIGVVSPFFTFPSFVERLAGIQDVLDGTDYDLTLYSIRSTAQLRRRLGALMLQNRVDGLFILALPISEDETFSANPALPIVVVDDTVHVRRYPHLLIDNVRGGQMATEYLLQHGHTRLGFLGDRVDESFGFTSAQDRFKGFQNTLEAAGLPVNMNWCQFCLHGEDYARDAARDILIQPDRPTAIFAAIDTLAFGVLDAASDLGLRVPEDLAVIGFDDIQAAGFAKLTTVRQHLFQSGQRSAELMLDWLRTGHVPSENWSTVMPLEIVERSTV
ncbi:MAG TPA: LacI family DNA-binding transcriptional regulator [Aggregatilinea sp.]|uniref:LacI family DNA-binding transcriptional regulator n=1 Tax=Aggregatilinea sp. TaxID=2806333 RepID=UPI002BAE6FA8|nr:LacI family DNA-binding transcriptional regulator [Aggregatilinea sp.]HML20579.1 LacI family DNA-binding transcriptional regulator [Aggregatilinea sp.]